MSSKTVYKCIYTCKAPFADQVTFVDQVPLLSLGVLCETGPRETKQNGGKYDSL